MRNMERWQMSASYPQDSVHCELRKILKTIATNAEKENKTETTVSLEQDNGCLRWFKNIKNEFSKLEETEMDDVEDVDEVDGKVDELLSPLVKLYFLKILLVDIGISLGDVVTDLLQGVNLTFDENWNIQWSTYHYGLTVFAFIWLPLIPVFLHQATFRKEDSVSDSVQRRFIKNILFVIFFPLVPTLMYIRLLLIRRRFNTNHQKLLYIKSEQEASQLKSIIGCLESPLQLILLLWLLIRGTLTLPWDQPLSASCIEDSLGRIACFPSIPLLSISFSFLSMVKSIFDLNLLPVLTSPLPGQTKGRLTGHIVLAYFPFLLSSLIFRLTSYAFIVTYIDYWAIIPAAIIYLASLSLLRLVVSNTEGPQVELPLDDLHTGRPPVEAGEAGQGLQWNGTEWLSTSSSCNYRANSSQPPGVGEEQEEQEEENKAGEHSKTQGGQIDIPSLINENNSPLFLNSVAAYFFPTIYTMFMEKNKTELGRKTEINMKFFAAFLKWHQKILNYQTLLFNSCLVFTLLVIGILVIFVPSFNYRTNILDCFWFSTILVFLIVTGLVCLLWSFSIYPTSIFPLESQQTQTAREVGAGAGAGAGEEHQARHQQSRRRRRVTGESIVESQCSAQEILTTPDIAGPPLSSLKVCWCAALSLAIVLPGIVGLLLFRLLPHHHLYLLTAHTHHHQLHLQALEVISSHQLPSIDFLQVNLQKNNSTKETLKLLTDEIDINLFIDDTEEESWRLSSPRRVLQEQPYIVVRNVDWSNMDLNPDLTFICGGDSLQYCADRLSKMMSCTNSEENRIYIQSSQKESHREERRPRKILDSDGRISQSLSLRATCFKNGLPCQDKLEKKNPWIQCNGITFSERVRFFTLDEVEMKNSKVILSNTGEMEYCCGNSTTFIKFYGNNCKKESFNECKFSEDFIDGVCQLNIQLHSSVCLIETCIIKKSLQTSCRDKSKGLVNCDIEEYDCKY